MPEVDKVVLECVPVVQPLGTFYVGAISAKDLCKITFTDIRRMAEEGNFESYLGIQRPLNENRIKEISKYVNSPDACFPASVILAISGKCAKFDDTKRLMTISPFIDKKQSENSITLDRIAKVIDGQHRIEGLRNYAGESFQVIVSIFVDMDVSDQAYLFSTVNLAQTKVNKSLVYDLFELAKTRSPQKTCHEIAVSLNASKGSPLFHRMKRLGVSESGLFDASITQATFVESLLSLISPDPAADRKSFLLKTKLPDILDSDKRKYPLRSLFAAKKDFEIGDVLWNYFEAVEERWKTAWNSAKKGNVLPRSNGFRALMRYLREIYPLASKKNIVPTKIEFKKYLIDIKLKDSDFSSERFKPGSSGESDLYKEFMKSLTNEFDFSNDEGMK